VAIFLSKSSRSVLVCSESAILTWSHCCLAGASKLWSSSDPSLRTYCATHLFWFPTAQWSGGAYSLTKYVPSNFPPSSVYTIDYGFSSLSHFWHSLFFGTNSTRRSLSCLDSFCLSSPSTGWQAIELNGYVSLWLGI
jgi:hypothetical protein